MAKHWFVTLLGGIFIAVVGMIVYKKAKGYAKNFKQLHISTTLGFQIVECKNKNKAILIPIKAVPVLLEDTYLRCKKLPTNVRVAGSKLFPKLKWDWGAEVHDGVTGNSFTV